MRQKSSLPSRLHRAAMAADSGIWNVRALFALVLSLSAAFVPACAARAAEAGQTSIISTIPDPPGRNLLENADFTRGHNLWVLEAGKPASASLEFLDSASAPRGVGGRVARIDVREVGPEPWSVQFLQTNLDMLDDEVYTVSFWARADRSRTIAVHSNVDAGDGHGTGLNADGLPVGPEWTRFALLFTQTGSMHGHNRLTFLLGRSQGVVDLAGLSLRLGKATHPGGANLLSNGDFTQATRYWSLEHSVPDAAATVRLATTDLVAGSLRRNVAHFDVTGLGKERWHVMFIQTGINLWEGEPYTLSFWAKADRPRPVTVEMGLDTPDWHNIGLSHRMALGTGWQRCSVSFTPLHTVREHARLSFLLADALGQIDLADVTLQREIAPVPYESRLAGGSAAPHAHRTETAASSIHPLIGVWESQTADGRERVRITFNADGTGSIRTGKSEADLDGPPHTRVADAFRWNLTSAEHRVVIGGDTYSWDIAGAGANERLTLKSKSGSAHVLARR